MSAGFIVGGKATCPVDGLSIRTFAEDAVHRFPSKGKRARAVELVIHETVTRSVDSTIAVLKKRALSVHLVMGADYLDERYRERRDALRNKWRKSLVWELPN